MTDEGGVLATLESYARAYCAKNTDALMALFDETAAVSLIGTGNDELCDDREKIRAVFERNFADATAERFEWHWRHVTTAGDAAAVAATLTIHLDINGEKLRVPVRWTVALVRRSNGWKWLHRNASVAASGQSSGAAYPR
ncbi:MAG: nuclear transport factor 2 family protein [Paracoccaceae bacterium]